MGAQRHETGFNKESIVTQKPALYKNISANFLGSAWTGLIALLFLPYYIRLMGGEAFAIIGVFISLVNILSVIDVGISPTLNRELASCSVHHDLERMRNTLRSLEYIYLPIVLVMSVILLSASPYIADQWLNSNKLPIPIIKLSLIIMSVVIASHLLINFYSAGISGLQFQVFLSTVNIIMVTLRYAGVVPVMLYFSPTPVVFFLWQLIINILHLLLLRSILWKKIHIPKHKPLFQSEIIHNIWRFSLGASVINLLGMITINMDKILLSKLLSLEEFGYYSVASIIAMSIAPRLASPFFAATYPRFTQYVKKGNKVKIIYLYHKISLTVATVIMPVTIFICFYADNILLLWTGSSTIAEYAGTVLIFLSIACSFTAVMYIPYALQLSYGWIRLPMCTSAVSLFSIVPLMIYLYPDYGANGVAFSWLLVNSLVTIISAGIMHKYLLLGEGMRWCLYDNGLVIVLVSLSAILLKSLFSGETLWQLCIVLTALYIVPLMSISSQRKSIINFLGTLCYARK